MGMSRKINQVMCFHRISCVHLPQDEGSRRRSGVIRLIKSDGGVTIYKRPIRAWDIMEEFPKHMVCRSDAFYIGQITPALSHRDRLHPGHNYFLLPTNFFQSALSFSALLRCRSPFELEKTASGILRVKVTEEMIVQHLKATEMEAEAARKMVRVCTTPQLRKDYDLLVGRRRLWKPKLDTIAEKKSLRKTKSNVV